MPINYSLVCAYPLPAARTYFCMYVVCIYYDNSYKITLLVQQVSEWVPAHVPVSTNWAKQLKAIGGASNKKHCTMHICMVNVTSAWLMIQVICTYELSKLGTYT
jgi:hypothetical protein